MAGRTNLQDQNHTTDTPEVPPASVQTRSLVDAAVTTAKLAAGAVTAAAIGAGAITTAKIADANVTAAKAIGRAAVGLPSGSAEVIGIRYILPIDTALDGIVSIPLIFAQPGRQFLLLDAVFNIDSAGAALSTGEVNVAAAPVTNAMLTDATGMIRASSVEIGPHDNGAVTFDRSGLADSHGFLILDIAYED